MFFNTVIPGATKILHHTVTTMALYREVYHPIHSSGTKCVFGTPFQKRVYTKKTSFSSFKAIKY